VSEQGFNMETDFKKRFIVALEVAPGRKLTLKQLLEKAEIRRGYTKPLDEMNVAGTITFARRQEGWKGDEVITLC